VGLQRGLFLFFLRLPHHTQKNLFAHAHDEAQQNTVDMRTAGQCSGSCSLHNQAPVRFLNKTHTVSKNRDLSSNGTTTTRVVFVNGIFGSVVEGYSDGIPASVPLTKLCARSFKQHRLWINGAEIAKFPCLKTYFSMVWDDTQHTWTNCPSVVTSVPKWGTTYAVDSLDPSLTIKMFSHYFADLTKGFKNVGYKQDTEIMAAAYDWRMIPDKEWAEKTRVLIEQAVERSNTTVVVVAHSLGCLRMHYFLSRMTQVWKAAHMHRLVAVSPPWAGSVMSLDSFFNGYDLAPLVGGFFGPLARHVPSDWFLLPIKAAFPADAVLLRTPSRNYTFSD
jgi:hypothetical protein